eukprot:gnl/TRDRNA2_/TRDRNA2_154265_c0_seq1.p1 gnl/TRDRNA2_/TRDRNA2_154265_c0~~gnl/TRDRNA2_/TRDRNA2_154265_c0_seq1.p1  ORF type:complete len:137 (+),score=3.55 gnl/TRDRNA2_/TRDRNA2_154265_c0_seq1:233-643(+)
MLNSHICRPAALAKVMNSTRLDCLAVAKAQATLATSISLISCIRRSTARANTASNTTLAVSDGPDVANAHARLARLCGVKSPTCRSATFASMSQNVASHWLVVAIAHDMFVRFCAIKLLVHAPTARFNVTKRAVPD